MSLSKQITDLLAISAEGLSENEMVSKLGLPGHLKKRLRQELGHLEERGKVLKNSRHRYALAGKTPSKGGLATAVFSLTSGGSSFAKTEDGTQEFFIPERHRGWALPGDLVEIRRLPPKPGGAFGAGRGGKKDRELKEVAAVARVIQRGREQLVGTFDRQGQDQLLVLHQGETEMEVLVKGVPASIPFGDWIVSTAPGLDLNGREPEPARFLSHLGGAGTAHLDTLILIKKAGLKEEFSPACLAEAKRLPEQPGEMDFAGRLDLRDQVVFTIDGADAKDFDDAVSIEPLRDGWRLGVHIADVSHYVRPGTALDKEAYERGTSVYLPDRVLPMLPEALSNGLCSLKPDVPRLALSALMEMDADGRMRSWSFASSVIRSTRRFTYEEVEAWLDKKEGLNEVEAKRLGPVLNTMRALALKRRALREARGGLDFDFPETKVDLDAQGVPMRLWRRTRLFAHQLIEEFMLAANEAVATELKKRNVPLLYRVHETPDEEKMKVTMAVLGRFKLGAPRSGALEPKDIQKILKRIEGKKEARLVNTLLLRSLKLARYDSRHDIHFGLALENYCHFTSPIRRYPDLVVHRALRAAVVDKLEPGALKALLAEVPAMGLHCSTMERKAEQCERDCVKAKQVRYLETRIGQVFDAVITSVTSFGFFAEIVEFPAEGLVPMGLLEDDYYSFDPDWMRLEGRNTKRRFQIGDAVKIKVKRADWMALQVDFSLAQ